MIEEDELKLTGKDFNVQTLDTIARKQVHVSLSETSKIAIEKSRTMLEAWLKDEKIVYGVTTGFGPLVSTLIPSKYQEELQANLIRSHAANVGPIFSVEETRAAMSLRLNAFSKGASAIRLSTVETMIAMLNAGVHPRIPEWGSVGASGDLTPSAHIALAIMGEGDVEYKGNVVPAKEALTSAGIEPVVFTAKEGLALINGTTMMTGVGGLQVHDAWVLVKTAEIISAMGIEALHGSVEPFSAVGHALKPHPGQLASAENLRTLLKGSHLVYNEERVQERRDVLQRKVVENGGIIDLDIHVQDVYSLRATPQILGAVRDALTYVTTQLETEMNSANDNPLFLVEEGVMYQGAHFHGQPVAMPLDMLSIAFTEIGVLSERRLNKLLDKARSNGLPAFLASGTPGLSCGFEGAQYIPTSLVAECRTLCNPASIQSIPSNEENQDVVSMGLIAARKARDIKERIAYILAVELAAVTQALEIRGIEKASPSAKAVHALIRQFVPSYDKDRVMSGDFEKIKSHVLAGDVLAEVESNIGELS